MGFKIKHGRLYLKFKTRKQDIAPVKVKGNRYIRHSIKQITKK